MLTESKVQTYKRFNGDIDGCARVTKKSNNDITENEWHGSIVKTKTDYLQTRTGINKILPAGK
jgi:hypothetical protein